MLESGTLRGVGGFSLLCGTLRRDPQDPSKLQPLAVISNRTVDRDAGVESHALWVGGAPEEGDEDKVVDGETHGLSNSLFDEPWPKVEIGRKLLDAVVNQSVEEAVDEDELVERLMEVLSHDTLPKIKKGDSYESEIGALVHSVFIPPFDAAVERRAETEQGQVVKDQNGEPTSTMKTQPMVDGSTPPPSATAAEPSSLTNGTATSPCCGSSTPTPPSSVKLPKKATPLVNTVLANSTVSPLGPGSNLKIDHICATPTKPTHPERHHCIPNVELDEDMKKSPRVYGTQTQTVILVDKTGRLKYIERRLWDEDVKPVKEEEGRDRIEEFFIEGWES